MVCLALLGAWGFIVNMMCRDKVSKTPRQQYLCLIDIQQIVVLCFLSYSCAFVIVAVVVSLSLCV